MQYLAHLLATYHPDDMTFMISNPVMVYEEEIADYMLTVPAELREKVYQAFVKKSRKRLQRDQEEQWDLEMLEHMERGKINSTSKREVI